MEIVFRVAWSEPEILWQLQQLARRNGRWLSEHPQAPLLYDAGVIYQIEPVETFSDVVNTLAAGWEDCDSLAAWRVGELLGRGHAALRPGDPAYQAAQRHKGLRSIPAEVMLTTRKAPGDTGGLYHAVVRMLIGGRWYTEDPSMRLGMRAGRIDPYVVARWQRAGVLEQTLNRWAAKGVKLDVSTPPTQRRPAPPPARPRPMRTR